MFEVVAAIKACHYFCKIFNQIIHYKKTIILTNNCIYNTFIHCNTFLKTANKKEKKPLKEINQKDDFQASPTLFIL